jgi:hypothetical protein
MSWERTAGRNALVPMASQPSKSAEEEDEVPHGTSATFNLGDETRKKARTINLEAEAAETPEPKKEMGPLRGDANTIAAAAGMIGEQSMIVEEKSREATIGVGGEEVDWAARYEVILEDVIEFESSLPNGEWDGYCRSVIAGYAKGRAEEAAARGDGPYDPTKPFDYSRCLVEAHVAFVAESERRGKLAALAARGAGEERGCVRSNWRITDVAAPAPNFPSGQPDTAGQDGATPEGQSAARPICLDPADWPPDAASAAGKSDAADRDDAELIPPGGSILCITKPPRATPSAGGSYNSL